MENRVQLLNKIATIRQALKAMEKDTKGRFDYISEAKLLDHIKEQLLKNKADFGINTMVDNSLKIEFMGGKDYIVYCVFQFAFTDLETGMQEFINFPYIGKQTDPAQALGTAYTYSTRYAMLKYFMIANGKDDIDNAPTHQTPSTDNVKQALLVDLTKLLKDNDNAKEMAKTLANGLKPNELSVEQLSYIIKEIKGVV